jgi:DNA-binding NarL/FixJ family response regulator
MKKPHTIFLADDHQAFLDGLTNILTSEGYEVVGTAKNGRDALDKLSVLRPELLLLDLDMPLMNGLETLKRIQESDFSLHVAILTMYTDLALINRAVLLGAQGFFSKTLDKSELLGGINRILDGGRSLHTSERELDFASSAHSTNKQNLIKYAQLSSQQVQVLSRLALGESNAQIKDVLQIPETQLAIDLAHIYDVVETNKTVGLIRFAVDVGLVD